MSNEETIAAYRVLAECSDLLKEGETQKISIMSGDKRYTLEIEDGKR
jgi:hypothetical protein